jgi:hypothetical protein
MTRAQRILKLSHAIDEYRGSYVPNSEPRKWIRHPKPAARERILKWLAELGVKDTVVAMLAINNFYDKPAMRTWLSHLETVDHGK